MDCLWSNLEVKKRPSLRQIGAKEREREKEKHLFNYSAQLDLLTSAN